MTVFEETVAQSLFRYEGHFKQRQSRCSIIFE